MWETLKLDQFLNNFLTPVISLISIHIYFSTDIRYEYFSTIKHTAKKIRNISIIYNCYVLLFCINLNKCPLHEIPCTCPKEGPEGTIIRKSSFIWNDTGYQHKCLCQIGSCLTTSTIKMWSYEHNICIRKKESKIHQMNSQIFIKRSHPKDFCLIQFSSSLFFSWRPVGRGQ